jgi:prepilin-type N-terminal cleavage/methylation domain-containing protein
MSMPSPTAPLRARGVSQRGFTMNELVMVLVIGGVLAAFAVPKLASFMGVRDDAWRDALASSMRMAQKFAVGHRRLVCASVANTEVSLRIASVNPATACNTNLPGPDGSAVFARASNAQATTVVSPSATIFFQPDGRVTTDGAGTNAVDWTLTPTDAAVITIFGETGHVE